MLFYIGGRRVSFAFAARCRQRTERRRGVPVGGPMRRVPTRSHIRGAKLLCQDRAAKLRSTTGQSVKPKRKLRLPGPGSDCGQPGGGRGGIWTDRHGLVAARSLAPCLFFPFFSFFFCLFCRWQQQMQTPRAPGVGRLVGVANGDCSVLCRRTSWMIQLYIMYHFIICFLYIIIHP